MKKITIIALLSIAAFATDYSAMSVTELRAARASVPSSDLPAFQSAMQSKVQTLSTVERQALQSSGQQYRAANQAATQSLSTADRQALQNSMVQNRGTAGTRGIGGGMGGRR